MKFSEFLNKREDERNALEKEIDSLRKEKTAALNKMLAKTLRDSSTWYDAVRQDNTTKLIVKPDVGDKIYAFRQSIKPYRDFSSHYKFPISEEDDIVCILSVRYPMPFEPLLKFIFGIYGNPPELDIDYIIEMSAKYLEDRADEMLKDPAKFEDLDGEKIGEFEMAEDDAEDVD